MDVFSAIFGRRSCRSFSNRPVEREKVMKMLEAACFAPSPANKQPWEFIVVSNPRYNEQLKAKVDAVLPKLAARSGWQWIPNYKADFLLNVPTLIVVVGDPSRNGAEQFLDEPAPGYLEACAAAVQNMMLAAHAQGLGSLWFTLFEKSDVRALFNIAANKDPLGVICVGYPEKIGQPPPRKPLESKVTFIE